MVIFGCIHVSFLCDEVKLPSLKLKQRVLDPEKWLLGKKADLFLGLFGLFIRTFRGEFLVYP